MQQHFINLYEYEEWANATLINALEPITELPARAEALMAHILLAQRIWYGRFVGDLYQGTVWDAIPRQQWLPMLQQNMANIRQFIATLNTPESMQQNEDRALYYTHRDTNHPETLNKFQIEDQLMILSMTYHCHIAIVQDLFYCKR